MLVLRVNKDLLQTRILNLLLNILRLFHRYTTYNFQLFRINGLFHWEEAIVSNTGTN